MVYKTFTVALLSAAVTVRALPTNGLWTGHDWSQDSDNYKFTNGVIGSDDPLI